MLVQLFNLALALLNWSHSFKGTFPMIFRGYAAMRGGVVTEDD